MNLGEGVTLETAFMKSRTLSRAAALEHGAPLTNVFHPRAWPALFAPLTLTLCCGQGEYASRQFSVITVGRTYNLRAENWDVMQVHFGVFRLPLELSLVRPPF